MTPYDINDLVAFVKQPNGSVKMQPKRAPLPPFEPLEQLWPQWHARTIIASMVPDRLQFALDDEHGVFLDYCWLMALVETAPIECRPSVRERVDLGIAIAAAAIDRRAIFGFGDAALTQEMVSQLNAALFDQELSRLRRGEGHLTDIFRHLLGLSPCPG